MKRTRRTLNGIFPDYDYPSLPSEARRRRDSGGSPLTGKAGLGTALDRPKAPVNFSVSVTIAAAPDGTHLLMERTAWKYESEGDYTDLVLFSPSSENATAPNLSKMLEDRFGKDCGSENSVIGFTPEGNVVVSVKPLEDEYYNEGATSCVKLRTLLALDAKHRLQNIANVLPGDFKVRHYGQRVEGKVSRNN